MRLGSSVLPFLLLGIGSLVNSTPTAGHGVEATLRTSGSVEKRCPFADLQAEIKRMPSKRLQTGAAPTPIDVTGEHAFQPPNVEAGDQRGPCPGLNALANHGYIPRNGIVTLAEVVPAINQVYGMGLDLATILGVMGTVWVGDPLSVAPGFSIGGKSPAINNILNNLGGLLGEAQGLVGSHNFIEADSSNTRDDLYVTGNNHKLNMDKFMQWYSMSEDGTFSMDLMAKRAKNRMDESIATNPNFYYGPFTGMIARNAGYIFAGRLFANYSSENPEGILTKDIIQHFFAVSGEEGNFTYQEGWERLPENWYRMPEDYGLLNLNLDVLDWVRQYPELGSIGGNTGKVNSFTGVDMSDLTGGLLNLTTLLQGNNLLCLVFEVLKTVSPNALSGLYSTLAVPLQLVENAIAAPLLDLACPAFKDMTMGGQPVWDALQNDFPGANMSKSAL